MDSGGGGGDRQVLWSTVGLIQKFKLWHKYSNRLKGFVAITIKLVVS